MSFTVFCSKCFGHAEDFTIKNGNLLCSKCAIDEKEKEEEEGNNKK